ncbi:MAG: hypothetical protein WA892_03575 [Ornithinimicrobium sp.]
MRHFARPRPQATVTPLSTRTRAVDPVVAARQRTVELLCTVLRDDPDVRARWQQHVSSSGHGIHQAAIATVLAEHQWASGEVSREHTDLPRRLKDTVSRALSGRTLSRRVLALFIDAFAMDPDTSHALWASYRGCQGDLPTRSARQRTSPQATQARSSMASSALA